MSRKSNTDVETPAETEEVVETSPEATADAPAKAKKEPARGDLPEGYVTPVGLAKVISERGLQKDREGNVVTDVKPQMVYSYLKNAPEADKFPVEQVTDSLGKERQAVSIEAGVAWWERKNERTELRKKNAAEKQAAKDKRAAQKAAEAEAAPETTEDAGEVTEAE
jgi:hypothetical protein